ncbi:UDP-N-acetylglucosamine-N-acetylmuramylpentapeptide N-acetylglucosamine transferase [Chelatococcus sambhunathii]|uniref:UDP-N-acetylglucosamine--N-acetylmuramyl-(pentapeptide) pyrophosphoryl-undecaprenol N-acetylglucosamine transferase n=1 Tax=Chelatococcus sambhunathii TaxID=363953 RepID=A0ABM9TYT3_9HYPH|nr:undecaprenyldiphospho-muramoylpentapeptide beta-N-acetylglucosaminyltransferase [Chelatococcus sambhunathii]CUA84153.1 UDP-N-acetylglucosamine-N-acetylmuramylpentapeptide N-acetylglucosamine transferase [Chelatococcus sambhunathii]
MSREGFVLLAAGGTGGHLFPAEALAAALGRRGVAVALATDERAAAYAHHFPASERFVIPSATPSRRSPFAAVQSFVTLARGVWRARRLMRERRPAVVVGFGGYPTVPPVLAATMAMVPSVIHEQNAVVGRANRFLMGRVTAIATGFATVKGLSEAARAKTTHTGNPVRPSVIEAATAPFRPLAPGERLSLLVFGGSQGARVMSDVVPVAVEQLGEAARARLHIVQQARPEDLERVRGIYARLGVFCEIEPFFNDLPRRMAAAHLVVSRAGASTVAELSVIGRPSILVPLPGALDQDQAANAASLGAIGAASVIAQGEFTPARLAAEIEARLDAPETLTRAAEAAKSAGIVDAAERLAALVIRIGRLAQEQASQTETTP